MLKETNCFENERILTLSEIEKVLITVERTLKHLERERWKQERDLRITTERIKNEIGRKNIFDKMGLFRKTKDIIENASIISPITVGGDMNYYMENGIIDVNRDIMMKLLRIVRDKMKIRNIIGMGEVFYIWSKQPIFRWTRNSYEKDIDFFLHTISNWLGGSKKFRLIYKAINDGFTGEAFHRECDDRGATVTIITSLEGYMFGGYAAMAWSSENAYKTDEEKQCFLFSLKNPHFDKPTRFNILDGTHAMLCSSSCGPVFGEGPDIFCADGSNVAEGSLSDLYTYSNPTALDSQTVFNGQLSFKAQDIEVYKVL